MHADPEQRAVPFCQELIRLESLSGEERAVADAVEREMQSLGYDDVRRDQMGSVVGLVRGARPGRTVLLDAHMDVVPATEPERWRAGPLSGERAEGRLWGRGATDVKGSLAALVVAAGCIDRTRLAGTLVVSASIGEEKVEGLAVAQVLAAHPIEVAVVAEPTGLRIGLGHKGRASLVVEAEGRAAHTSRPENGINAVYRLVEAIDRVRALARHADDLLGPGHAELVEISSLPYPGSSMVPYRAAARFDRRLVRGETRESVLAEVRQALAGLEGVSASMHQAELRCYTGRSFTVEAFHPAWAIEAGSELAVRARRVLEGAGLSAETFYAPYCTNGATTAGERGIPTILYGAGDISVAHAVDESIDENEVVQAVRGYRALALALGRPGEDSR